jgi:hypothetical protein
VPAWTGVETWDPPAGAAAAKGIGLGAQTSLIETGAPSVTPGSLRESPSPLLQMVASRA